MVENVFKRPPYAQFKYEQELQRRNLETFGSMVGYWQKELNDFYKMTLIDKGYDLVVAEMFFERYNSVIKSVNTAEEVTALYKHFVTIIKLGDYIFQAAENYANKIAEQITELESTPICPCCGGYIPPDFIDELKIRYDDLQEQIKFYEVFTDQRRDDMKRLNDKVRRQEIKVEMWQVPQRTFSRSAEDDERESVGVG